MLGMYTLRKIQKIIFQRIFNKNEREVDVMAQNLRPRIFSLFLF